MDLHSNIWWLEGLDLIGNVLSYARAHALCWKGIQFVDDIWDNRARNFIKWIGVALRMKLSSCGQFWHKAVEVNE